MQTCDYHITNSKISGDGDGDGWVCFGTLVPSEWVVPEVVLGLALAVY